MRDLVFSLAEGGQEEESKEFVTLSLAAEAEGRGRGRQFIVIMISTAWLVGRRNDQLQLDYFCVEMPRIELFW